VDAVRLVFVDGLFRAELSDSVQESGFDIVINDERQSASSRTMYFGRCFVSR